MNFPLINYKLNCTYIYIYIIMLATCWKLKIIRDVIHSFVALRKITQTRSYLLGLFRYLSFFLPLPTDAKINIKCFLKRHDRLSVALENVWPLYFHFLANKIIMIRRSVLYLTSIAYLLYYYYYKYYKYRIFPYDWCIIQLLCDFRDFSHFLT